MTALTRIVLVGVVVPLAIAVAGVLTMLAALPELPDPVAMHWSVAGQVDGTGPVWLALIIVAVVPLGYGAFVLLLARPGTRGPMTANMRLITATAPFLSAVITITIAGSVLVQRGIDSAYDASGIGWLLAAGLGTGIMLAVLGWLVLPASQPAPAPEPAAAMALGATEKAVWMQRIGPSRAVIAVLAVAAGLVAAVCVLVWLLSPLPLAMGFTATMLLLGVLVASTLVWHVTVGASGLRVRSAIGWPDYRVPLAEVASVASIDVDPVRDFGGWGIRWGGRRRWGVIVRRGAGIDVQRRDGSSFVVTVPAAGEGAALLASLADRTG
jgi:hypothetical protein